MCSLLLAVQDARARYGVLKERVPHDAAHRTRGSGRSAKGAGIRERNTPSELHRVPITEREVEDRRALTVRARKASGRGPTRTSSMSSQWFTGSRPHPGHGDPSVDIELQKGGDPAAPSGTATLLRLRPNRRSHLRQLPPLRVGPLTSGVTDFHDVTGGVYKARERIHRSVADLRLLATPASCSRVADCNPN